MPGTKKQRTDDQQDGEKMEEAQPNPYMDCKVQDLMQKYYAKLYPHQQIYKWLAYGNDSKHAQAQANFFQKREFCFTMDGDIFVRYQSFKDGQELAEALVRKCPSKIDLGPVYSHNPQDRQKYMNANPPFAPCQRELVFDIDLTDYDDVRTCGKEGHICEKCWPLMAVAMQVIDRGLREDFGFQNILWVYSGRRGVHCWVCDPSARALSDEQRSAVASYFSVYKGHEADRVKLMMGAGGALHPLLEASVDMLRRTWEEDILPQQKILQDETMRANVLKYIPDEVKETVERSWEKASGISARTGQDINLVRWEQLQEAVDSKLAEHKHNKSRDFKVLRLLERCITEIIFVHTFPRLDVEVSKKMNHLLKAPFCVHPKTCKVCVPLEPEQAHLFDLENVPDVRKLLWQLPQEQLSEPKKIKEGWRSTDLAPSIELFERNFLAGCQKANRNQLSELSREAASQGLNSAQF